MISITSDVIFATRERDPRIHPDRNLLLHREFRHTNYAGKRNYTIIYLSYTDKRVRSLNRPSASQHITRRTSLGALGANALTGNSRSGLFIGPLRNYRECGFNLKEREGATWPIRPSRVASRDLFIVRFRGRARALAREKDARRSERDGVKIDVPGGVRPPE